MEWIHENDVEERWTVVEVAAVEEVEIHHSRTTGKYNIFNIIKFLCGIWNDVKILYISVYIYMISSRRMTQNISPRCSIYRPKPGLGSSLKNRLHVNVAKTTFTSCAFRHAAPTIWNTPSSPDWLGPIDIWTSCVQCKQKVPGRSLIFLQNDFKSG